MYIHILVISGNSIALLHQNSKFYKKPSIAHIVLHNTRWLTESAEARKITKT